ncbi:MAG: DUF222 domain-containing protein [Woeseia sp.]
MAKTQIQVHPGDGESAKPGAEIAELSAYISAATYRLLALIREFDEREYWHLPGLCSCAHWLNFKCGIDMNAAREKVRVAHALAKLPKISEAFRKGQVSYSKVRAMQQQRYAEQSFSADVGAEAPTKRHFRCDARMHWSRSPRPISIRS